MKKILDIRLIIFILAGILLLGSISALTQTQNVTVTVLPPSVAYIFHNEKNVEQEVLNVFSEMNLDVDLIQDKNIRATNFSNYSFIFVGNEKISKLKYLPKTTHYIYMNSRYGRESGFLKLWKIAKIASNSPLVVLEDGRKIIVYETADFKLGGVNIPYYYLPEKYKAKGITSIATTDVGYKKKPGTVIGYNGGNCFFGITEAKFWTKDTEKLFKDCAEFVLGY